MINNTENLTKLKIGDVLVAAGCITEQQLMEALAYQKEHRKERLGDIMVTLGYITEDDKLKALSKRLQIPIISIADHNVDLEAVAVIPVATARKYSAIAIGFEAGSLMLVVNDPMNFFAIEDIRQMAKKPVTLYLAPVADIERAVDKYYAEVSAMRAASRANRSVDLGSEKPAQTTQLRDSDDAPVVKLLNSLLVKGFNSGVSDIHIEPFEEKISVRMRVDGMIVEYISLLPTLHQPLIARIKILSNLNIAEKRIPQDGHFRINLEGVDMNIRVSVMPTIYGEKAVLRFLNTNTIIDNEGNFSMRPENYEKMMTLLNNPHGIIYMTGPTGSGKTTTLYLILQYLSNRLVNIATIEDPVEKNIPKICQSQINPAAGLTFESGLRSILRQDPDIIMVGETRDGETAEISVRSAITGHLVLSTLHTNDSVSTIIRLEEMGIPAHLVASSLVGVVAQRLMRKVCPECGYDYEPDEIETKALGKKLPKVRQGKGCHVCNNTGYQGRTAIHEIMVIDHELRNMINSGATADEMKEYIAGAQKATLLEDEALRLVEDGTTTVEEYIRITYNA